MAAAATTTDNNNARALKALYLDSGVYARILRLQYEALEVFLSASAWDVRDIVVLDIDETVVCDLPWIDATYESELTVHDQAMFNKTTNLNPWLLESRRVVDLLHSRDLAYAFVTGRKESLRALTEKNLALLGMDRYTHLYMCPNELATPTSASVAAFKERCRLDLERQGYRVICSVGDQVSDVAGSGAGHPFLLFNPFYSTQQQ